MKKRILVTYRLPEEWLARLAEDFEILQPQRKRFSEIEIIEQAENVDAILSVFGVPVPVETVEKFGRLKIISNYGVGVDHIPVVTATKYGILVTNTPGAVTEATAELTIGLMLSCARRIAECDRKIRSQEIQWGVETNLGTTLVGKVLGIIGMGKIGRAVAKRANAMGMSVIYFNRYPLSSKEENQLEVSYYPLSELLLQADVVSLHVPLSRETFHMIGLNELSLMKSEAYFINTARGAVVNEDDLLNALSGKMIKGAGLDVFEQEPKIPDELLKMDNVVLMPHSGTATIEDRKAIADMSIQNIIDFFDGKRPRYIVNPEVFSK